MQMLKKMLLLDERGNKGMKTAVLACTLTSLSLMIPFSITLQIFMEILKPLTGDVISWNRLWLLFGIGLVAFLIVFLLSKNDYRKTYGNAYEQAEGTRLRVAEQMRKLPLSFFNSRDLSELAGNIMSDCSNIEQTMSSAVPQLIANIISITLVCILLAFFDWRMAIALFITLPIAFGIFLLSRRMQAKAFEQQIAARLKAEKQSQEYMEGIKVIRACGLGGERFKALDEAFLDLKAAAIRVEITSGAFMAVASMILRAGVGITAFTGIVLLTGGKINFLTMLMFLLIAVRIYGPILTVLTLLPDMLYMQISTKRLRTLMEAEVMNGETDVTADNLDLTFEQVSFGYNEEKVLRDVSFTIHEHQITALVGPSGSGKSTISKLAARFFDVDSGTIRLGGNDVKGMDPEYLMKHMSFVFQEVTLFNDTIEANIRIGRPGATKEEVLAAAKAARCDEFVERLPNGYDTLLGENGSTLSGGERQRLSIARALLKDAPIILLDEATASLDPENEVLVQEAISGLIKEKTVLVIAHRLRTVAGADHIIVLEEGQVKEEGDHEELMRAKGLYRKLYDIQQENISFNWGQPVSGNDPA